MANVNRIEYDKWIFTDHEIVNGNLNKEKSLLSSNLSIDTLNFTVMCNDISIINFTQNTPVVYFYGKEQKGTFYLRTVERIGKNQYKISATSSIILLAQMQHKGGIYTGQKVEDIVKDICGDIPVIVKTILKDIEIYGWLPYATARDNLAHVLFAIGAYLGTDINGALRVETLWGNPASAILPNRIFTGGTVKYAAPITSVAVTEHQYYIGEEETKLFEGTAQNGDIITFDEPMHSLTASGFAIQESGANYAILSSGSGTLSGKKYIHNTRTIIKEIAKSESKNDIIIENETLISVNNSNAVADWVSGYYKCSETIENPIVAGEEQPGHIVLIYHPYDDRLVSACISNLDSSMSSFLKSNMASLVDFTPPKHDMESTAIYDQEVLITQNGKIELPSGVKRFRAILIGGGNGGNYGGNGESGTNGTNAVIAYGQSGSKKGEAGKGGSGGVGGAPGNGGNIQIIDAELKEGEELIANIGSGGVGGTADSPVGNIGDHTILSVGSTQYTSATGDNSGKGFIDTITGLKYALPGIFGNSGGKGGDASKSLEEPGQSGESISIYSGGSGESGRSAITGGGSQQVTGNPSITTESEITEEKVPFYTFASMEQYWTAYQEYTISKDGSLEFKNPIVIGNIDGQITIGEGYIQEGMTSTTEPAVSAHKITYKVATRKVEYTEGESIYYVTSGWTYIHVTIPISSYSSTLKTGNTGSGGGGAANGTSAIDKNGANALPPVRADTYGGGGNGGNGGGGGGGGGAGVAEASGDIAQAPVAGTGYGQSGGIGGAGSSGGNGAQGCIILYFGAEKKFESGQFATRGRKMLVGANNRRFIV